MARMVSGGIDPQAYNRQQRASRAGDGMKDLGDAYKKKGKAAAPPPDEGDGEDNCDNKD